MSAEGLMGLKKLFGADYIRREGLITENADKKFGSDWLDKDHGPPTLAHCVNGLNKRQPSAEKKAG